MSKSREEIEDQTGLRTEAARRRAEKEEVERTEAARRARETLEFLKRGMSNERTR
jgi:hypothetical protein